MEKQEFHFEAERGWINDPNGLCQWKGVYHIFHQYNPYSLQWDRMHWGHATTSDFQKFDYQPIALTPDESYENEGGCFSGSAVLKDNKIYLFYTSVSKELGQTQSMAVSSDGIHFEKYAKNPIIAENPVGHPVDFRDPKVSYLDGHYYMVVAGGIDGEGILYLYRSETLYDWQYVGELLRSAEYGQILECPDFFKMGNHYFLSFSMTSDHPYRVITLVGNFDGEHFYPQKRFDTESGPDYYAPQSFEDEQGRRISIGWIPTWRSERPISQQVTGALTVPREVTYHNGVLRHFPIQEFSNRLTSSDPHVLVDQNTITFFDGKKNLASRTYPSVECVDIIRDKNILEVFINKGEYTATFWYFE